MEKDRVSQSVFEKYSMIGLYPYGDLNVNDLIYIHKFFKGKMICDNNDENHIYSQDAGKNFLYQLLHRPLFTPCYNKIIDDFFVSDYLSNEIKEIVSKSLDDKASDAVKELLNNNCSFNDMSCSEIKSITSEIDNNKEYRRSLILDDYLFYLDGNGPVEYIKLLYRDRDLARLIICHSGVNPNLDYANDGINIIGFNENNLLSIYDKYNKFFPDKKDSLFDFVNLINYLTANNFVNNYSTFVDNGFNSNIPYFEDNEWYNKLNKGYQVEMDKLNENMHINFNHGVHEREKVFELKKQF